jgi:RimJ/RimL family protein N-acetyltransferase
VSELFPDAIVTERLRLERESLAETDLGERYESMNRAAIDDDELAYVPVEAFEHLNDAREYVATREERMESGHAGTYVVRPREGEEGAGEIAGETEIFAHWEERRAFFTIGLRKRFWGRGYSGERAAAFVALAFERLDLDLVSVTHLSGNENSRRAIEGYVERFGGQCDGCFRNEYVLDGEPHDLYRYTVTRANYDASDARVDVEFVDDTTADGDEGGAST